MATNDSGDDEIVKRDLDDKSVVPIPDRAATAAKAVAVEARRESQPEEAPQSLGFALRLESGKALLELKDKPLQKGVTIGRLEMEIPKVKFPFDVSGGAERFHSQRCVLRSLVLHLSHDALNEQLHRPALEDAGFYDVEAGPENGALTITGAYKDGDTRVPFSFAMAPVIMAPRELGLLPFDERVFGACKLPAPRLPWLMLQALGGLPLKTNQPVFDVVAMSVRELLPRYGWKIPDTADVGLIQAEISKNGWIIACGRGLLGESKSASRVSFAVEARAPFEAIENELYRDEDKLALTAYRKHVDEEVPHRFAVRRYLQLAAADERTHEEGRSVAEEALIKDEHNTDALLFLAAYALNEGDAPTAAKHYAHAAQMLWQEKSERAAALCDVRAAELARTFDVDAARSSLSRTLKKRKADPRALQASFQLEKSAGNVKGATLAGEKLLRVSEDGDKFRVHLSLGQMLLDHDLKKAKLHAERALRARMEDPDAIRLVARIFSKSGDVPRAVRYLSRLSERFIAQSDLAVATAIEIEIAEQLERTEHEAGYDPRALLSRYQRILTLDPSSRQAMLRAAQLGYALGELAVAKRWYEELASDEGTAGDTTLRAEATFRLGEIAMSEARESDAEASFEAALLGPFSEQAYTALRRIYETRGDVRALFSLEKRLGANTDDLASRLEHHLRAAELAAQQNLLDAEINHLEAALTLAPSDATVKRRLLDAVANLQGQDAVEALLAKWAPKEHEPTTRAEWYLELANLRENKNDLKGAKTALDQAIKADPTSAEANEALYVLCQKLEEPYGAFAALGNLARYRHASDEAKAEIRITQAELLAGPLKRRDEARAYLLRALIDVPHHIRGLKLLGELALEQNDAAMAEDAWRRFLETGAEEGRDFALESLARLSKAKGDLQEQFNFLFELWQLTQRAEIFDELRAVLKERGDFHRLVLLLRDATASATGDKQQELRWQTALLLRDSVGDWAGAREELLPLSDVEGPYGDLARRALVELAENEGRPDLLAQALERELRFIGPDKEPEVRLQIARAYREWGDHDRAQAAYSWVIEREPGQDEALAYLAERAETTGNAQLAFGLQLSRFAAGFADALPALARVADTVPSSVLIANIQKLDRVPPRFALDLAGRLDAEGYSNEAVEAIHRALSRLDDVTERTPLVLAVARIEETSLAKPQRAIETLKKEHERAPTATDVKSALDSLIERAGAPRERAELVLERAVASGAVTQMWTAFEALVEAAPDHDRLGSLFAEVALHPALRARVIDFLAREDAGRVVGDAVRANVLLSIHDSEPLATPMLTLLARLMKAGGELTAAQRLLRELSQRSPEDEAIFAEWLATLDTAEAKKSAEKERLLGRRAALERAEDHRGLAELLLLGLKQGLVEKDALIEVRELLAKADDAPAALKVAVTVTAAFPADIAHWVRRGELAARADDPDAVTQTLDDLGQALATTEGLDPGVLPDLEKRFATALLAAGHTRQARALLEALLARDPLDEESFRALEAATPDAPATLLPWARARADAAEGKAKIAATRDYLAIAIRAPDPGAALAALALLAEANAVDVTDVEQGFLLVAKKPERLSEVWDWAELLALTATNDGKRRIAAICQDIGDEAADEIRASIVGAIPPRDQTEQETLYLARRLDRTGHADLALGLLRQVAFDGVLASAELSALWLDAAVTTNDLPAKLELLAARARVEGASLSARVDYAEALVAAHDETKAFAELQALVVAPGFSDDPRAATLRQTHRQLLLQNARAQLKNDPNAALQLADRLLAESPSSEEAWILSVDAARLSQDDARLIGLLEGRPLSAQLFAELGAAYERQGRLADAANAFLEANKLQENRVWLDGALMLLDRAGDKARLATEILSHAPGHPDERALLERALALFTEIGDAQKSAELTTRLFDAHPDDERAYARVKTLLETDAAGLARAMQKRLTVVEDEERRALALELARLYVEKLFTHDDAEKLLTTELADAKAAQLALYDIFVATNDTHRAASVAKRLFTAEPADDAAYARHRRHVEDGGSTIDLFELLEARIDALPQEGRDAVAMEAAAIAIDRLHDADAAEHALKKAFTDERQFVQRALSLYDRFADEDRAAACVRRLFELDPADDEIYQRHRLWLEQKGDLEALLSALETRASALDGAKKSAAALEAARVALDRAKQPQRAGAILDTFFGPIPQESAALQLRIAIHLRLGNDLEAMALLKGLAAGTEDPASKASVLLQAAGIAERVGVKKEAATLWAMAFFTAPSADEAAKRATYVGELDVETRHKVIRTALPFLQGKDKTDTELALSAELEEQGELGEALALAKSALSRDPEAAELRARVGALYEKLGNTESLVQLLAEQHATSLDRAERHKLAMQIAYKAEHDLHDLEQAVHFYRQATKDDPTQQAPLIELVRLYGERNQGAERCDAMEALIQLTPASKERGEMCLKVGEWRSERGEADKAALAYLHAFAEAISTPNARRAVKLVTKRNLYVDEAIRALRHVAEASETPQERVEALRDAAEIIADKKQDYAAAAAMLREVLQQGTPTRDDRVRLVEWLERAGDHIGAIDELFVMIAAEEREDSKNLLIRRAQTFADSSGDSRVKLHLQKRLIASGRLAPDDLLSHLQGLLGAGEREDARALVEQIYDGRPNDRARLAGVLGDAKESDLLVQLVLSRAQPETRGQALCEAATILENADEADRAYALYREALTDKLDLDEKVLVHIADLAERRNDDTLLSSVYLRIGESDASAATRARAYFAMAKLWLEKTKDKARADDCLVACLRLEPDHKEARRMRARLLIEAGRAQEAAPYLDDLGPQAGDDPSFVIAAAKAMGDAGDVDKARAMLKPLAREHDTAFWTLFDLESKHESHAAVVRMLTDRMDSAGAIDTLDRYRIAAKHAQAASIPAAEEKFLAALHSDGVHDPKVYARLAALTLARSDLDGAHKWTTAEATHAATDQERAQALQAAGELARTLGKTDEAQRQLEAALNLNPTAIAILDQLFELYRTANDAERLLMVGERVIIVDPQAKRGQAFYLALADAAEHTRTDAARIMEFYQLAAAVEPLDAEGLQKAIAAAEAAGKDNERLDWEEERLTQVQATADDYIRLGNIAKDRLKDDARAERYYRLAKSTDPKATGPVHALAGLLAPQKGKTQEAIALYREMQQRAPTDPEPYRLLARLYGQEQDVDRTFQFYDLLRALDPADEEAERFITAAQRVLTELPPRGLGKNELGQIADPGLLTPLQQFFGPLAAQAEMLYATDIARIGLGDQDLIQLDQGFGRRLAILMQRMSGRALEVLSYRAKVGGRDAIIEPGAPAKLIVSMDTPEMPPRAMQFVVCRALGSLALGHLLPSRLPTTDLATLLGLLAKRFIPEVSVANVPDDRAAFVIDRFKAVTPDDQWGGHVPVAQAFAEGSLNAPTFAQDIEAWVKSGERTCDRWALLMCGDLAQAFSATKQVGHVRTTPLPARGQQRMAAIMARPDLLDLINFASSDMYLSVRQALGLTLRR